jgi:ectoine hydroxylase-related dioxygenase (phytanoyl-CoA dioxygenase family)
MHAVLRRAASDRAVGEAVAAGGYELAGGGFELGDVSFHAGWTFHRAGANTSAATRKVMTIIYMDSGMRMAAPVNANQRADAARYLEGVAPGEVCAGPRNPLLWPRQEEAQETQAQEQVQAQAQAEAEAQAQAQAQAEGAGVGAV